jgi:hypothetical protein
VKGKNSYSFIGNLHRCSLFGAVEVVGFVEVVRFDEFKGF